ncbi:MAG: hypothetical protein CVT94_00720 [Bacteroidetes bacterium HGW-Bacteroidetes-11]|jgi:hypothetical protein|nr:MAG: hypothetical protein CVT94_00720 [Bacteroidetes bacterium HGW-Bacteroidetes-11]
MKKILLVFYLFCISLISSAQSPWREGEMQVKVFAEQPEQQQLIKQLNINADFAGDFLRCYLTLQEYESLLASGIRCEVEIPDLNQWSASFGPLGVPTGYYTVGQLNEIADSLATHFPDICTLHTIGIASNFDVIYALKISDNSSVDENEPEILFDGGIHGDEIGASENMIRFARDLCLGYENDPYITDLVNNREIWIIYCLNPYGRSAMTRYNLPGVDINRDCGYMWNGEGNSTSAFSQPETKALRGMLTDNQFVIHCSYHSGIEFISFPWSYRASQTPDHAQHQYLASLYASTSGYANIPYQQGYSGMYPINGSTKDFGYGAVGAISWSVEISVSKQPPASQIVPIYLKNKPAMLAMCEYAGYGISGMVTDETTSEPVSANIFVNDFYPISTDPEVGDFHKFLVPGNYELKVIANGYEPQTLTNVVVSSQSSTFINVELQPATGQYARALVSSYIPNNNPNDEGFTPAALGPPDGVQYSIGRFGWAVFDMGTPVINGEGPDVIVHENDATPEGYTLFAGVTIDGPWRPMGTGIGTTSFDLSVTFLSEARFFKITDDGDGQSQVNNAGFDLDAIEGIVRIPPVDSTGYISGFIYEYHNPTQVVEGATVYSGEYSTISGSDGFFLIRADTGNVQICAEHWSRWLYDCDSVYVNPGDTLNHNMYLYYVEKVSKMDYPAISIYPNPSKGLAKISVQGNAVIEKIIALDNSGAVHNVPFYPDGSGSAIADFSGHSAGFYILEISLKDGEIMHAKIVIQ